MVVTVSITRLNTRLLQPCFMVVTTLNYNLVTTLLHPCNKVVISVWAGIKIASDIVFAIGYQVCIGTSRVPTVIQLTCIVLLSVPPRLTQSTTSTDLVCRDLWPLSVFEVKSRCYGLQH